MKPSAHFQQKFWNRLKAKEFGGTSLSVVGKCMIQIFRGAGLVTPSKPPPPTNNFCLHPPPAVKMFLERSLNDPHHSTLSIFHCYPLPIHTPFPLKILIIHTKVPPAPPPLLGSIAVELLQYDDNS